MNKRVKTFDVEDKKLVEGAKSKTSKSFSLFIKKTSKIQQLGISYQKKLYNPLAISNKL